MCGIVGAIANRNIVPLLTEGLRRVGRVAEMEAGIAAEGLTGMLGIGHTRWATHGGVTELNGAHLAFK